MTAKLLSGLALTFVGATAFADVEDRLYDFTDAYYLQNGVNPAKIAGRRQPVVPGATTSPPNFPHQRDVRSLRVNPAYDHSGNTSNFFAVMGGLGPDGFTANSAGNQARSIADQAPEYVFPKLGSNPVALGGGRQANILDMRHGYFSNNKLGLWIHVWVNFTPKALNTARGQADLRAMVRRNGAALDGTPIIRTIGEIDNLYSKGYVTKLTTQDATRYAICPVIKDPTDGGIAIDQTLAIIRKPDGNPLEPFFLRDFESLRLTGDWP